MGTTKSRRRARKLEQRTPWEENVTRRKGGQLVEIPCARCHRPVTTRYWDPARQRYVCFDCVPHGVTFPIWHTSRPGQRPMALD